MSTFYQQPQPVNYQPQQPPTAPKKARKLRMYGIPVAALLIGAALGYGGTPEPEVVTETVTKEVEVETPVLPQSCVKAFQEGEEVMNYYGEIGHLASDSVGAAYDRNGPLLDSLTDDVAALSEKVKTQAGVYGGQKGLCSKETGTKIPFVMSSKP